MSNLRILVVEDEFLVARSIKTALSNLGYQVIGHAYSMEEAKEILQEVEIDFVLLDITLRGNQTGIDLAKIIREQYRIPFVFLTSHSDPGTLAEAKKVNPDGYLVKPFTQESVFAAIEIAMANFSNPQAHENSEEAEAKTGAGAGNEVIFVKKNQNFIRVNIDSIEFLKSDRVYIEAHTARQKHLIRSNFDDLIEKLGAEKFLRVHRSYAINLEKVSLINKTHLCIGEKEIPLGRSYRDELLKRFETL